MLRISSLLHNTEFQTVSQMGAVVPCGGTKVRCSQDPRLLYDAVLLRSERIRYETYYRNRTTTWSLRFPTKTFLWAISVLRQNFSHLSIYFSRLRRCQRSRYGLNTMMNILVHIWWQLLTCTIVYDMPVYYSTRYWHNYYLILWYSCFRCLFLSSSFSCYSEMG